MYLWLLLVIILTFFSGADAVGMSNAHECLVARHMDMKVISIALITNKVSNRLIYYLSQNYGDPFIRS